MSPLLFLSEAWRAQLVLACVFLLLILAGVLDARRRYGRSWPYGWAGFAALGIVGALASGMILFASSSIREQIQRPLQKFAPIYASAMLRLGLDKVTLDTPPDDPRYLSLIEAQKLWLRENPFMADLYVMVLDAQGRPRFLVDSETDYDGDGLYAGERESRTEIGELYDDSDDPTLREAFRGVSSFDPEITTDRWGQWLGLYYPLRNSAGETAWVVGLDFPADRFLRQLVEAHGFALLAAVALLALAWLGLVGLSYMRLELAKQKRLEAELRKTQKFTEHVQSIAQLGGWELDASSGKTRWTTEVYRIYGLPEDTPTDKVQGIRYYLPHERERITRCVEEALRGKAYSEVFEFQDEKGNLKWVEARGEPVRGADGEVVALRGTIQDITQRRHWELEAQRAGQRAQELQKEMLRFFEVGLDLLCIAGMDGRFRRVNKAFERVLGYGQEELLSRPFIDFVHPDDVEATLREVEKLASGAPTLRFVNRFRAKDGSYRVLSWATNPDTEAGLLYAAARDISEERAMAETLEKERAKLIHHSKLASLGELAASVAHEINNPLAIVSGNLNILEKFKDQPERLQHKVQTMERAIQRIERIISGLRRFSRSTETKVRKSELLSGLMDEVLVMVEGKARRKDVRIECDISDGTALSCDGVEIEQVLVNLVNNAIDAASDSEERWVRVEGRRQGEETVLRVSDSGPGISPEVESRIFEPFFTTKPVGEGTGLGLSVTKGILDSHGARLRLDRESPNTCFEIRFPG